MRTLFTFRLVSALVIGCAAVASHAASDMSDGVVTKIDPKGQTITLKHGEIKNLGMGAMTMAFKAKSSDLLTQVKVGDKVKFKAEMAQGALAVIAIERAP